MDWKTMLAYISGSVDEELLLRNEYLVAENRILRNQTKGRLRLNGAPFSAVNGLAGCSVSTIGKPHEYLDPTGMERSSTLPVRGTRFSSTTRPR